MTILLGTRTMPGQQHKEFRCPLCGSSYFGSSVKDGVPQHGYCKGPQELASAPPPWRGYFSHFLGCTFRWDRRHDAAVFHLPDEGN